VLENKTPRRIFGSKREGRTRKIVTYEYTMRKFVVRTFLNIAMLKETGNAKIFYYGNLKEREFFGIIELDIRIILKWILNMI
jgi:hypothetical protein